MVVAVAAFLVVSGFRDILIRAQSYVDNLEDRNV